MIQSLEELVVPGRVLRLFCSFTNQPKEKFVVVVATHPFCLGFLINSNPTALLAQLTQGSSRVLGLITDATRKQIIDVVGESMTLEGGISKIIVKNLINS